MSDKRLHQLITSDSAHPVGDGFLVQSIFTHQQLGEAVSPFLLLDYGAPITVLPGGPVRGVGEHPHKGFETVTVVFQGELAHRDSSGGAGIIGAGDVQWMTAGAGLVHEELYSEAFARDGGTLEFAQLWVNLPAASKLAPPAYQTLQSTEIPHQEFSGGRVRIIAGNFAGVSGPAHTFSPLGVWDIHLEAGASLDLPLPEGWMAALIPRRGVLRLSGSDAPIRSALALLTPEGSGVHVSADETTDFLVLTGAPLGESVVAHGPFVMNTQDEIREALQEYRAGKMGHLS